MGGDGYTHNNNISDEYLVTVKLNELMVSAESGRSSNAEICLLDTVMTRVYQWFSFISFPPSVIFRALVDSTFVSKINTTL